MPDTPRKRPTAASLGRLEARPSHHNEVAQLSGLHALGLDETRDGLIYVPASYRPEQPAPFVLMLHGAGGTARNGLIPFLHLAEERGLFLLAPYARMQTWDVIAGGYGHDVALIDEALEHTFSRYVIDPTHVAIEGFSDGASYALSLGLTNGDLFTHIMAFSPGFMAPTGHTGSPHIYISHGTFDPVLPVKRCSRMIVPQLQQAKYDVKYHEFNGLHTVPENIASEALDWFLQSA